MWCLSGWLQSQYEELAINYQLILFQANLLSCLSTAMGLVHEPPLPNGVVNLWQPNSGTQCGAYGWWTEPYAHRYNTQLLDDIASHPPLRRHQHHHQLAHVDWPVADMRSHMKISFSQEKNSSKCMTLQCGQQADIRQCMLPSHTIGGQEDSAQSTVGDTVACVAMIHSIPRGNMKTKRKPTARREVPRSSQDGLET